MYTHVISLLTFIINVHYTTFYTFTDFVNNRCIKWIYFFIYFLHFVNFSSFLSFPGLENEPRTFLLFIYKYSTAELQRLSRYFHPSLIFLYFLTLFKAPHSFLCERKKSFYKENRVLNPLR